MKLYVCEITEINLEEDTVTIKIPECFKINGLGNIFISDAQNGLIEKN